MIEKIVFNILKESCFCEEIKLKNKLKEDLGLDSLSMVELILTLEETFSIEIDESDLDPAALLTVEDICNLADKYVRNSSCCTIY